MKHEVRFIANGKSLILEVDNQIVTTDVPFSQRPPLDMRGAELFISYGGLPFDETFTFPDLSEQEVSLIKLQYEYLRDPHHVRERIAKAYRVAA